MKSGKRTRDVKSQTIPEIIEQTRIEHVGTQCMLIGGPLVDTQLSNPSQDATMEPALETGHATTDPISSGDVTMDSIHSGGNTMDSMRSGGNTMDSMRSGGNTMDSMRSGGNTMDADETDRGSMMDGETWTSDGSQQEDMEKIVAKIMTKDCH